MMEPTLAKASMRDFLARRLLVLADAEMAEITRGILLCGHVQPADTKQYLVLIRAGASLEYAVLQPDARVTGWIVR